MEPSELETRAKTRAVAERVRLVKLAGTNRYLARSRTAEPGSYFELDVSPWGHIRCSCAAYLYRGVCKHAMALRLRLARERQGQ
jgi:uncharacterized Zn finger protein